MIQYKVKKYRGGFIIEKIDMDTTLIEYYGFGSSKISWWSGVEYIDKYCIEKNASKVKKVFNKLINNEDEVDINNIKTGIFKYIPKVKWSWKN